MINTKRLSDDINGIRDAAEMLKNGGVVAVPTETVYGLAASAFDTDAIGRVFSAKGRPQDNPLIVHIADMKMLEAVVCDVPDIALLLAQKFWPGPLTLVLPKSEKISSVVSGGLSTVAVRMPSNAVVHDIIETANLPLAAPSANLSGSPSPTKASHVLSDLDGKIDAVVMSGDCAVGVESTVLTLCTEPPRLLRPGGITAEQLREIIPNLVVDKAVISEPEKNTPVASPGMKYKHYSPKTEVIMVETERFDEFMRDKCGCGALCFAEDEKAIYCPHVVYGSCAVPETLAEGLFSALRAVDSLEVDTVYAHAPKKDGVSLAVYNRLIRAAAFRVIKY